MIKFKQTKFHEFVLIKKRDVYVQTMLVKIHFISIPRTATLYSIQLFALYLNQKKGYLIGYLIMYSVHVLQEWQMYRANLSDSVPE